MDHSRSTHEYSRVATESNQHVVAAIAHATSAFTNAASAGSDATSSPTGSFTGPEHSGIALLDQASRCRHAMVTFRLRMHPLDALGNPVRRQILLELREQPLAVGDLASRFPISRPAISKHLRTLETAGLVESRIEGTRSVYSVRLQGLASVRAFIDDFWDTALDRLAALANEESSRKKRS